MLGIVYVVYVIVFKCNTHLYHTLMMQFFLLYQAKGKLLGFCCVAHLYCRFYGRLQGFKV
jgi:hypothetical protein